MRISPPSRAIGANISPAVRRGRLIGKQHLTADYLFLVRISLKIAKALNETYGQPGYHGGADG